MLIITTQQLPVSKQAFEEMVVGLMPAINELLEEHERLNATSMYDFTSVMIASLVEDGKSMEEICQSLRFFIIGWCAAHRFSKEDTSA